MIKATDSICKRCGNCDQNRFKYEIHVFKDGTRHIKSTCKDCQKKQHVKKSEVNESSILVKQLNETIRDMEVGKESFTRKELYNLIKFQTAYGMEIEDIIEAIEIAWFNGRLQDDESRLKYACGVLWNKLKTY